MGRLFGTLGFAIDLPLEVEVSESKGIRSDDEWACACVEKFCERYAIEGAEVEIRKKIPRSVGLGFHTTLALSIGAALSRLYQLNLNLSEIALTVRRGAITALGVYAFERGGFIIEGGFKVEEKEKMIPPLIFRSPLPENWYFVIAVPDEPKKEVMKIRRREEEILKQLKPMRKEISDELSRMVLVKIIPSILEGDLDSFGRGLTDFNSKLGEFWYGGRKRYCHPVVEKGIKVMLEAGPCACQSSWGPAFYGIVKGEVKAQGLVERLRPVVGEGEVFYTKANNSGAVVEVLNG
jgi:beta-ribofuranosylaminobenzene 5'-phosphate synthase